MPNKHDYSRIPGRRFGHLIAIDLKKIGDCDAHNGWLCLCDCGKSKVVRADHLIKNETKTCGCGLLHVTHGHTKKRRSVEYNAFSAARARCNSPSRPGYAGYGGRGIKFRFSSFTEFLGHLGTKPEPKSDYSLDRIDNNGHYEPGNVRWATRSQQMKNRRPFRRRTKQEILASI